MNFDRLERHQSVAFSFKINTTAEGLYTINDQISSLKPTRINYFDEFQDPQTINGRNAIFIQVSELILNEKLGSFPEVEVDELEVNTIILFASGILLIALLSRLVHFKKPMDI